METYYNYIILKAERQSVDNRTLLKITKKLDFRQENSSVLSLNIWSALYSAVHHALVGTSSFVLK